MGRITIFTAEDCSHCRLVKAAFDERGIPYVEISLTRHPERRVDMLGLTDRVTVPQVFINDQHAGGADDTIKLLLKWDLEEIEERLVHTQMEKRRRRKSYDEADVGDQEAGVGGASGTAVAVEQAVAATGNGSSGGADEDQKTKSHTLYAYNKYCGPNVPEPTDPKLQPDEDDDPLSSSPGAGIATAAAADDHGGPAPPRTQAQCIAIPCGTSSTCGSTGSTYGSGEFHVVHGDSDGEFHVGSGEFSLSSIGVPGPAGTSEQPVNKVSILAMTEMLKSILPCKSHTRKLTTYSNSFTGAEAVVAIKAYYKEGMGVHIDDVTAITFGTSLMREHKLFSCVRRRRRSRKLENSTTAYYRLQCYEQPAVMNSYRVWTERVDPNSMRLVRHLRRMLMKIEKANTTSRGYVDYVACKNHELYPVFEEAVCELQGVDYDTMEYPMKLAFSINLYNLMITYAFIKVGLAESATDRSTFFNNVSFQIGSSAVAAAATTFSSSVSSIGSSITGDGGEGYDSDDNYSTVSNSTNGSAASKSKSKATCVTLSFQDLEHGILRGNKKAPYSLQPQFGSKDPRRQLSMDHVDPRIHFALNCGANSCPPFANYTAEGIDEELRIVSQAFCEDDAQVMLDPDKNTIHLTLIFKWYMSDFCSSSAELPGVVVQYLFGEKRLILEHMIEKSQAKKTKIKIQFQAYDWSTNASEYVPLSSRTLKANKFRLFS